MCVTNFMCILLEIKYTWLRVFLHLQISCVLVGFGHNLLYWEFENRYSKKPLSITKQDISDHIYLLIYISLWFYSSWFGCNNLSEKATLRPKMWIVWHNANSLEFNSENGWPWHCPTTCPEGKKDVILLK